MYITRPLERPSRDQERKRMGDVGHGLLTGDQYVIDCLSRCYDSMSDLGDLRGTKRAGKKPSSSSSPQLAID